jgi:hypothetical protein
MPTLRYIGPQRTKKNDASAKEDGKRARSVAGAEPPRFGAINVLTESLGLKAKRNALEEDDIVKRVNRLSIDPSKDAISTKVTTVNDAIKGSTTTLSEKENINQTSFSLLRSPTKSPFAKVTKHFDHQKASLTRNNIFRLASPIVTDPSSLFFRSGSIRTSSNLSNPQPSRVQYSQNNPAYYPTYYPCDGMSLTYPYDEMQANHFPPYHSSSFPLHSYHKIEEKSALRYGSEFNDSKYSQIYQPNQDAANACARFYLGYPVVQGSVDHGGAKAIEATKHSSNTTYDDLKYVHSSAARGHLQVKQEKEILTEAHIPPKPSSSTTKEKETKDPNAPKRAKSAYLFYVAEMHNQIKSECPGISFGELSQVIGQRWKGLSPEQKTQYNIMAMEDRARYYSELTVYEKSKTEKCGSDSVV